MSNRDLRQAWKYHNETKHSYQSIRTDPHILDWDNHPLPFKVYSDLDPIPLPTEVKSPEMGTLRAIATFETPARRSNLPDLATLGRILLLSAGITKKRMYPGGELYFRAAACTGALYHIDLYLVCSHLPGLEAGVYHFGPHDFSLRRLRLGDFRKVLVHATAEEESTSQSPVILISASTYWRNAWKYRARMYRHCGWDNGTLLANLLAAATSHEVSAKVVCGFVDKEIEHLLGLEGGQEAALSLIPLGRFNDPPGKPPAITTLTLNTVPLSRTTIEFPAIQEIHAASSLISSEEVASWRGMLSLPKSPEPTGKLYALNPAQEIDELDEPITTVIIRRGSTRKFARKPITFEQLSSVLVHAIQPISADFQKDAGAGVGLLNDVYLIVHDVEGLPAGAYLYHKREKMLELLKEGDFRRQAGHLGLGQELSADASVNVFFLVDLNPVLERFGNRGYRATQLEAGILGGRLYLAAYALRLGATGLTFFDDDVIEFFSPHAKGKSVMFLVALGHKARKQEQ